VNIQNSKKATPLHYAAFNGNEKISKALLEKGAKLDVEDMNGHTPIFNAKMAGHSAIFEKLMRQLITTKGASTAVEVIRKEVSNPSEARQYMLQVGKAFIISGRDSIEFDPQLLEVASEFAGGLLRDILSHPTPRGLDFRLVRKQLVHISVRTAEAVLMSNSGHFDQVPKYSSKDLLEGRNRHAPDIHGISIPTKCEEDAVNRFDKFQDWCVSKQSKGGIEDLLGEIVGALKSVAMLAGETARHHQEDQ